MSIKISAKTKLLLDDELLTKEVVAKKLNIGEASAVNVLARWNAEGVIGRTSPGVYVSTLIGQRREALRIESLVQGLKKEIVLVGASCWKEAGWCESEMIHVAVADKPSAQMPHINDAKVYAVGHKDFKSVKDCSRPSEIASVPVLNPVTQMLWWMDHACPIMMISPHYIHWDIVNANEELVKQMKVHWHDFKGVDLMTPEAIYGMIYMDRRDGTTPGLTDDPKFPTAKETRHGHTNR